jgi:xylose isomerase
MNWRYAANAGFFGARRDRFNQYQPDRTLAEKFALISQVEGLSGIELKYPGDLDDRDQVRALLAEYNLQLAAVNVNVKDVRYFRYGSFSSLHQEARRRAIRLVKEGMDVAAELGVELVTTCPTIDGYDYPFQVNYMAAWEHLIESIRQAAAHRTDVKLLLEYQPNDPNARSLLGSVGKVLHLCAEVDAPNLGANLDVGHSLAAGENPAEAATLLAGKGLLQYIHSNDNLGYGGDWDMISGTVHFWHWVELLYTLQRLGYGGWVGGDIAPRHFGPVEAYQSNVNMIRRMTRLIERAGYEQLYTLMEQDGNTNQVYESLMSVLADQNHE